MTAKIVRGIAFLDGGRFLEPPYGIELYLLDEVDQFILDALER